MEPCNACPRHCNADRTCSEGWCRSDDRIHVSSLVIHKGEEPPISGEKGIVNLFFPSCNMQCIYCQNWEISRRGTQGTVMTLNEVCDAIIDLLPMSEGNLGFVSPTHFTPQMISIVDELRKCGHYPTIVYNSNGYDLPETIRSLDGIVDVWLPDFKYSDDDLAQELSDVPHYSKFALSSLKEMVHQVGTTLQTDDRGIARRGIILRHLVLPGFVDNSIGVLKLISENLSPNLHISLMSQYYPPDNFRFSNDLNKSKFANRKSQILNIAPCFASRSLDGGWSPESLKHPISSFEYNLVVSAFHESGLSRGWLQDYNSHLNYRPDFSKEMPFE